MGNNHYHQGLHIVSRCPMCNARYRPWEAAVLEACKDAHLMYIQCRACSSSILALVYVSEDRAESVGVMTDLTRDEVMKYRGAEEVSVDDVIVIHHMLQV